MSTNLRILRYEENVEEEKSSKFFKSFIPELNFELAIRYYLF